MQLDAYVEEMARETRGLARQRGPETRSSQLEGGIAGDCKMANREAAATARQKGDRPPDGSAWEAFGGPKIRHLGRREKRMMGAAAWRGARLGK